MIKILMHGCNGKMGRMITEIAKQDQNVEIVAGVDKYTAVANEYPVFETISECDVDADAVIDFSNAGAVDELLDYCVEKKLPVVLCTTGLSEEQLARVKEVSEKIAVLKSANMSMGINLLLKLLKDAAKVLAPAGYDMELVEKHHNHKLDAPSGTALALADSMNEALGNEYEYVYDRSQVRKKRDAKEIGISAVRAGTIVGEHEVIFAGTDEVIEFKHTAYSRSVFAKGAVEAAKFLADQKHGMYDMGDVIRLMSRQLGEAMMDSLGVRVEDTFSVGIDLEKALANPGSTADIVLREGDVISIPKNNNTVTINGAVMVPNTVSYIEGQKVDYYLDQAGGYSENAKKSKKFIVYMNGQVTKVKGSGKKQIEPGCEIIVPSKAKKRTNIGNILGYATTFSTLGMMVASIANLIKK